MQEKDCHISRERFLQILKRSGVLGIDRHPDYDGFLKNEADIKVLDLHIDSLALIEIAIAIEEIFDVSLSPEKIGAKKTLAEILNLIEAPNI